MIYTKAEPVNCLLFCSRISCRNHWKTAFYWRARVRYLRRPIIRGIVWNRVFLRLQSKILTTSTKWPTIKSCLILKNTTTKCESPITYWKTSKPSTRGKSKLEQVLLSVLIQWVRVQIIQLMKLCKLWSIVTALKDLKS